MPELCSVHAQTAITLRPNAGYRVRNAALFWFYRHPPRNYGHRRFHTWLSRILR
jgi:hypothetical protein